jgi:hypothetical protein
MQNGWATEEFSNVSLGDKRLDKRLVKICDSFSESPESPINQACSDWAETKGAYRFFKNENVKTEKILEAHKEKTAERASKHELILAIQDTSYLIYTDHPKTRGLGKINMKKGKNVKEIFSHGLIMHTSLAVNTDGLPLGILDQKICARPAYPDDRNNDKLPIEDKESYRWLESLKNSKDLMNETKIVTICDREADIYEFFNLSEEIDSPVLVRANQNRAVNKKSRYSEEDHLKLWDFMEKQPIAGEFAVEVPAKDGKPSRIATLELKFGSFTFNPPRNNVKHKTCNFPNLIMYAVFVFEKKPPEGIDPLEWMLLTNLKVNSFDEAFEKVRWYCFRWRIEMFHKVLKSGFRVEDCRLGAADRLIKYLTVMSIVAWRIFMVTLIARTNPDLPCNQYLTDNEWKVLYMKVNNKKKCPKKIPKIREVVIWIAKLGGFLARKGDGDPGTITLWRGWKRLADLTEGWNLALQC